jgi:hypothetical protein
MRQEDRRKVPRFAPVHLTGALVLRAAEQEFPILAVHDISPFGIGIIITCPIPKSTAIELVYTHEDKTLTIGGTVAWGVAEPATTDAQGCFHRVGISLHPRTMSSNIRFFELLTQEVDLSAQAAYRV